MIITAALSSPPGNTGGLFVVWGMSVLDSGIEDEVNMSRTLAKMLCEERMCLSMGEARRLIVGGVVRVNGEIKKDPQEEMKGEGRLNIGKRKETIVGEMGEK